MPTTHTKLYRTEGYKAGGQIISWAHFHDLQCYAVKREQGIYEDSGMSAWFSRQIQYEYRKRWKIPLRKMRQYFLEGFRWWYYDGRNGEAVIVLCKDKKWDTELIFDPMWLTNLSHSDVNILYLHHIFFDVKDMEQALQFMRVIMIHMVFRIYAGSDWKAISDKYFKKDTAK
ncbi:hypothetical protein E3N88_00186 [Mikania micrantha]|uniref:Uncharacterized protein n=1 Tax=Mikania micrantha TaxID=192012 RepID=A0A5N6Q034_9ASTR|nr:hypothetical protein E3N88_00186 [Mikania micrantha]